MFWFNSVDLLNKYDLFVVLIGMIHFFYCNDLHTKFNMILKLVALLGTSENYSVKVSYNRIDIKLIKTIKT